MKQYSEILYSWGYINEAIHLCKIIGKADEVLEKFYSLNNTKQEIK